MSRRDPGGGRRKLKEEMVELMGGDESGPAAERRWMTTALAYFHNVSRKASERVDDSAMKQDRGGMSIQLGGHRYWVPLRSDRRDTA